MTRQEELTYFCENIDAEVFTGDALYTCDLSEFKEYLARWGRAIEEREANEGDENALNEMLS